MSCIKSASLESLRTKLTHATLSIRKTTGCAGLPFPGGEDVSTEVGSVVFLLAPERSSP
jgi:hypothetical protein